MTSRSFNPPSDTAQALSSTVHDTAPSRGIQCSHSLPRVDIQINIRVDVSVLWLAILQDEFDNVDIFVRPEDCVQLLIGWSSLETLNSLCSVINRVCCISRPSIQVTSMEGRLTIDNFN
jgi:hypothetical protein